MNLPKIKNFPFTSILGWSVSRYDVFKNCKRQYFYSYYPKFDKEIPFTKIQKLKSLTSVALETGNIVHDSIRDLLVRLQKTAKPISRPRFLQYVNKMAEDYCNSKTFCEVYYKQKESVTAQDLIPQINKINNYKAYCKVDYLIPVKDNIYILDWKTGKPDIQKHSRQLIGYSLWASYHFNTNAKNITSTVVYLSPTYNEYTVILTDEMLSQFQQQVEDETKQMYEFLTDIENNIPKEKECFEKTDNEFFCKYCNFRELCKNNF